MSKDYLKLIKQSPIAFKIKKTARLLFSAYENLHPDYNFEADSTVLAKDLENAFVSAISVLFKEEKKEKFNISGWPESSIFGFVSSNLQTHWDYEYIYSKSEKFKQLMLLKSIILFLEFDHHLIKKIENIYNYLINNKFDSVVTNSQDKKVVDFEKFKHKKTSNISSEIFSKHITEFIESILLEKHGIYFNEFSNTEILNIDGFFTFNEIKDLISFCATSSKL